MSATPCHHRETRRENARRRSALPLARVGLRYRPAVRHQGRVVPASARCYCFPLENLELFFAQDHLVGHPCRRRIGQPIWFLDALGLPQVHLDHLDHLVAEAIQNCRLYRPGCGLVP